MSKETNNGSPESRPDWEHLADWLRGQVQGPILGLLGQEVTEFLGRAKSARRSEPEHRTGYGNGYGKPRKVSLASGTIKVRRPGCGTLRNSSKAGCSPCSSTGAGRWRT